MLTKLKTFTPVVTTLGSVPPPSRPVVRPARLFVPPPKMLVKFSGAPIHKETLTGASTGVFSPTTVTGVVVVQLPPMVAEVETKLKTLAPQAH